MAYKKFDDPNIDVSQKDGEVYKAFPNESKRKALVGVGNRVLGGTSGTSSVLAGLGTGSTGGVSVGNPVLASINGRMGTITAQADLELPAGTQAAATYVKYLVSSGFGSSGTVTAGNEGTSGTKAFLPNLPAGHVALGYVQYNANGTRGFIRTNSVLSGVAAGTNGTVGDWEDLVSIPFTD
jgi:hypothetical protein